MHRIPALARAAPRPSTMHPVCIQHVPTRLGRFAAGMVVIAFSAGCATTHRLKVDAIRNPAAQPAGPAYALVSGSRLPTDAEECFDEAAALVENALASRGHYPAASAADADYIVYLQTGISGPRQRASMHRTQTPAVVGPDGRWRSVEMPGADMPADMSDWDSPTVLANRTVVRMHTTYEKYLRLAARERKAVRSGQPPRELWAVSVRTRDTNDDLTAALPLLAAAAMDHIDTHLPETATVVLREDDERVRFISRDRERADATTPLLARDIGGSPER